MERRTSSAPYRPKPCQTDVVIPSRRAARNLLFLSAKTSLATSPRPLRDGFSTCPWQTHLLPSSQKLIHAAVRINRWSMILHQPARIRRRAVVAMDFPPQHSKHSHQLPAMMGRMRNPTHHDPRMTPKYIEESGLSLPPCICLSSQSYEPLPAIFRISLDEFHSCLLGGQRRSAHIDSEHVAKPQILTHALMHHLFMRAAPSRIAFPRPHRQVLIKEFTPDADHFQPLGCV